MESSSSAPWLSFRQKPRSGQIQVWSQIDPLKNQLNIKLPTGYGKTYTMAGAYSILQRAEWVNRLLVILPFDVQIDQFKRDGWGDLRNANVEPFNSIGQFLDKKDRGTLLEIIDLRFYTLDQVIKRHNGNTGQIFVTTVQSLVESRGMLTVGNLLKTGSWMVCVDEYHHYGIEKSWGRAVVSLKPNFLLAMSATPTRPDDDSAFGAPQVSVKYEDAVKERAVKPLRGHAYAYKIDAVTEDGDVRSFTTSELIEEAGGDSPERIERLVIKRKMRWSPKYVSPLVSIPIDRMLSERLRTGFKLQVLIGAFCVSHAELVYKQVKDMYPELRVEWVGTGEFGRSDDVNKDIIRKFCPQKDDNGNRPDAEIDILVHVGIAGEGLDSVFVSEVIHLNNASVCNRRNQENGRASRYLEGVLGHINFDSSSEYAKYVGEKIEQAFDYDPDNPPPLDPPDDPPPDDDPPIMPEWPEITIANVELMGIDSGNSGVQMMARVAEKQGNLVPDVVFSDLWKTDGTPNQESPGWNSIIGLFRGMREVENSLYNREAVIVQWREAVQNALGVVAGRVVTIMRKSGRMNGRFEKSLPGDIKKRINTRKKRLLGEVQPDVDLCKQHYRWLKDLETEIVTSGLPSWLW